jgi:glycosyltransferase involved in cell wall biosynthesis
MLKILHIFYEPILSGQSTHVLSLTKYLVKNGHTVTVVLPDRLVQEIDPSSLSGTNLIPLPLGKIFWKPNAVIQFRRLVRRGGYQIVHVHSQEAGLIARPLARLSGAKAIVYTPQTIDIRQNRWSKAYSLVERLLAMFTDKLISVNEVDRLRLIQWGIPASKVVTIPNGIDVDYSNEPPASPNIRQDLGIEPTCSIVMQVGRLAPQKNPLAFIEGAQLVLREIPDAHFVLVGDGPLKEVLEKQINALELGGRIHVLGRYPDANLLVASANVVTLTSLWEGTPYSLLEAMAWEIPIVATNVNGCREIVLDSETGLLSPPGDVQLWAMNVARLLREPDLAKKMGERGKRRLEEQFTIQNMVTRIEDLYYELATAG